MSGQTPQAVALAAGVCPRTIRKWLPIAEMAVDHARLKAPHQPSRPHWEQPIEAPQLVMEPNSVRISHAQTMHPTRIKAGKPISCFNTIGTCESKDFQVQDIAMAPHPNTCKSTN